MKRAIITMAGVAVIIAIIYLAYLSHKGFEETMVSQTQQQLLTIAKSTGISLKDFIQHVQRNLVIGSNNPEIQTIAQKSILENEEHEKEYHIFKAIFEKFDIKIDRFNLLNRNGIVLDRIPFKKERIGASYIDKLGVKHVLREHKPYISEMFETKSYDLNANCYITKPVDLNQFISVVKSINEFWLSIVRLPGGVESW